MTFLRNYFIPTRILVFRSICLTFYLVLFLNCPSTCAKTKNWELIDKQVKSGIYQVNVAVNIKIDEKYFAQLADFSSHKHGIFALTTTTPGYRVVGTGTCFSFNTTNKSIKGNYFITNKHVIDSDKNYINECKNYFAAMRLYAEESCGLLSANYRYKDLLKINNLSIKKNLSPMEKNIYLSTTNAIWNCYEQKLSRKVDPQGLRLKKYIEMTKLKTESSYFLHPTGSVKTLPLQASLYKIAKNEKEPDLAILSVKNAKISKLNLASIEAKEGQEIQAVGFPLSADQLDKYSGSYYAPTYSTGHVTRVSPKFIQIDAAVSEGNSGGPVINAEGEVIGIMVRKTLLLKRLGNSNIQVPLSNFGGALTVACLKEFAPELF